MFRWLPLVWANLRRRKLRLVFTFISILLAFLMFGMLDALRTSLSQAVNLAGADRLMLQSKVNITVSNAALALREGEGGAGRARGRAVQLVRRRLQGQQAADPGAGDGSGSSS